MPRIYPPKYKKPLPKWIGETAFVLVVCFFVTFGWILADMTGMERGLKACDVVEASKTPQEKILELTGHNLPVECNYLYESQYKAIPDE